MPLSQSISSPSYARLNPQMKTVCSNSLPPFRRANSSSSNTGLRNAQSFTIGALTSIWNATSPLLAFRDDQILGVCTLHQQLGGWKRHIGRVSVHVHPDFRGRGLARALVTEVIEIARQSGLERIEAEFVGAQDAAMKTFAHLGFNELFRLPDYVKDMQAINHDYILMGLELITDEEYAGMG